MDPCSESVQKMLAMVRIDLDAATLPLPIFNSLISSLSQAVGIISGFKQEIAASKIK
jgi:hypothetical protein